MEKKVGLKTKIEAGLVVCILLTIGISSVMSVTRTITDTSDNIDTFIRNSNGKYWDASPWDAYLNIQAAIDDLGDITSQKGYVWLPADASFEIYATIELDDNIVLDMQGSMFEGVADIDIVRMDVGSELRNGFITTIDSTLEAGGGWHSSCIVFDAGEVGNFGDDLTIVENIRMMSANQNGTGISMFADGDSEQIVFVTIRDIKTEDFKYGIHLNCSGGGAGVSSYINSNNFYNCRGEEDEYFIYLERNTSETHINSAVDGNLFYSLSFECGSPTENIIYSDGQYNHFEGLIWDWGSAGGSVSINLTSDSQYCFMDVAGGSPDVVDSGDNNSLWDYETGTYNISGTLNPTLFLIPCYGTPPTTADGQMYMDTGNYSLVVYYNSSWHWHEED